MGFFHKKNFKSAQIGHFGAKNAQKVPFSENASEFFCPLLFQKNRVCPLWCGLFRVFSSQNQHKMASKMISPFLQLWKPGQNRHENRCRIVTPMPSNECNILSKRHLRHGVVWKNIAAHLQCNILFRSFLSSPNPSVPFINQNNPSFDLKAS